jgi:putative RNA 2'-phosphotransferase
MPTTKKQSKFLSLILRHQPDKFGVVLDSAGWTDVGLLLEAMAKGGTPTTRDELGELVMTSDKQRFALSDDGTRIRANQGHSVEIELGLAPLAPPDVLYHGTVAEFLDGIRAHGLIKGARHHVHLSADLDTAKKVGGRRGKPVILTVQAARMAAAGHSFWRSENGVWLAEHVPTEFIEGLG